MTIDSNAGLYAEARGVAARLDELGLKSSAQRLLSALTISSLPGEVLGEIRAALQEIERDKVTAGVLAAIDSALAYIDAVLRPYRILFPDDFDDDERLIEAKGWFDLSVEVDGRRIGLSFYDPVRLAQTIEDAIAADEIHWEEKLVVVPRVTRAAMEAAVKWLHATGRLAKA